MKGSEPATYLDKPLKVAWLIKTAPVKRTLVSERSIQLQQQAGREMVPRNTLPGGQEGTENLVIWDRGQAREQRLLQKEIQKAPVPSGQYRMEVRGKIRKRQRTHMRPREGWTRK